jgi:phage tail tape-measure protein
MMEQSEIAWTTLLGSAEEAKKTIEDLKELGAKTPFEFEGLDKSAKLLNMAGFEGEKLRETLIAVGDAVSAVGGGQEELEGVSMALFQMSAKGKASAEEMNQLAERYLNSAYAQRCA